MAFFCIVIIPMIMAAITWNVYVSYITGLLLFFAYLFVRSFSVFKSLLFSRNLETDLRYLELGNSTARIETLEKTGESLITELDFGSHLKRFEIRITTMNMIELEEVEKSLYYAIGYMEKPEFRIGDFKISTPYGYELSHTKDWNSTKESLILKNVFLYEKFTYIVLTYMLQSEKSNSDEFDKMLAIYKIINDSSFDNAKLKKGVVKYLT